MKLLILGGSGFVSGRLAQIATAQGHEVWCVTRGNRPIPEGVHALTCDAHDPAALCAALASAQLQWDAALDCICRDAASASVDLSVLPAFTNRLLVISTDSVYHPAYKRVPQDETGVYLHDGGYGRRFFWTRRRIPNLLSRGQFFVRGIFSARVHRSAVSRSIPGSRI